MAARSDRASEFVGVLVGLFTQKRHAEEKAFFLPHEVHNSSVGRTSLNGTGSGGRVLDVGLKKGWVFAEVKGLEKGTKVGRGR